MIRPLTIVTFLMACGSGLYLYQSKHAAQVLDRDIERTVRDTATLREQSRLLAAEWTMLNDPDTLRRFSDQYLALKSISPTQFTSLADLKTRLPIVTVNTPPSAPADVTDPDEDAPVVMSGADTPPAEPASPAAAPAAVAPPAAVAAKEPKPAAPQTPAPTVVALAKPPIERPAERKPTPVVAKPSPVAKTPDQRSTDQRPAEPRVADARSPETRPAPEPKPVEARLAEPKAAPAAPRPTILAASAPRVAPASAPAPAPQAYVPAAAPAQPAYSGSLLGMARTGASAAPVARPMPVSTAQWSNAN
jgi:hypothetical protein